MHRLSLLAILLAVAASAKEEPPVKPPVGIPTDALYFKGKWYRVFVERGGWKRARQRCLNLGGQLATVHEQTTHGFIKELASELPLWLGAEDEKADGTWHWLDGKRMTFTAWDEGQPNKLPREFYLIIARSGYWHDATENAADVLGFVCEWKGK